MRFQNLIAWPMWDPIVTGGETANRPETTTCSSTSGFRGTPLHNTITNTTPRLPGSTTTQANAGLLPSFTTDLLSKPPNGLKTDTGSGTTLPCSARTHKNPETASAVGNLASKPNRVPAGPHPPRTRWNSRSTSRLCSNSGTSGRTARATSPFATTPQWLSPWMPTR